MKKLTTEQFIEKSIKKHGGKYDYSNVEYKNNTLKVKIVCPIHGMFMQLASGHLVGRGCHKCSLDLLNGTIESRRKSFIEKAVTTHKNLYDYSKVEYVNNSTKVIVGCPIHGEFKIKPNNHVDDFQGCPKCGRIKSDKSRLSSTQKWINKAIKVHGNCYDYSKSIYTHNRGDIKIICKYHGEFILMAQNHLQGYQCKYCGNESKGRSRKAFY